MISHQHRCIFIHIPKTGGTSVENLLWPPRSERTPADLWMGCSNGFHNKYQTGGLQHLLASQVREEVGREVFDSYFKFAIVRNPWDRVISQYLYMRQRKALREFIGMRDGDSLNRYLELISKRVHVQWMQQIAFVRDHDGQPLLDYIGRFEAFEQSVREITARLNVDPRAIPHEKANTRTHYRDYHDEESREMVASMYASDIEAFAYTYDEA